MASPWTLHDFPAHRTELQATHRDELARRARQITGTQRTSDAVRCVRILGHAATWRGISEDEYERRSLARAQAAADELGSGLEMDGLSVRIEYENPPDVDLDDDDDCAPVSGFDVTLYVGGRGDDEPLVDNLVSRSDPEARGNRAWNRRVEIFPIVPKPVVPSCTDQDLGQALRAMDLARAARDRPEELFEEELHRIGARCVAQKLVLKLLRGDDVDDKIVLRWRGLRSSTHPRPVWRSLESLLRRRCKAVGGITEDDLLDVYVRMVRPPARLVWPITQVLADLTPNPFGGETLQEIKAKIPEVRAIKPIYDKAADKDSVYFCVKGWLRPAFRECFR